jgi:hypothetical protein
MTLMLRCGQSITNLECIKIAECQMEKGLDDDEVTNISVLVMIK